MSDRATANIFDIKRFAVHDGPGIRTTVFFKGCPLKCIWCHNPEGISKKPQLSYNTDKCINCGECVSVCKTEAHSMEHNRHQFDVSACIACGECEKVCLGDALKLYGKNMTVDEIFDAVIVDKDFYDTSGGGVTLSGGECLMQSDFCAQLMRKFKESDISCCVDTSGCVPRENIEKVIDYTKMFLYDIKFYDSDLHKKYTGKSNELILNNLLYIDKIGVPTEIRIPVILTVNEEESDKIALFIKDLKCICGVRLLKYNKLAGSKYTRCAMSNTMPDVSPPSDVEIRNFAKPFLERNINIII